MIVELPVTTTISAQNSGPTVAILGGVHGDEYEGVIAALSLAKNLPNELISGRVLITSPAHPASWNSGKRNSPIDGADLARVFPGKPDGSATEQVAHMLTEQVIKGADVLIDLHSAGTNFDMPFLCGFNGGTHRWGKESERLAKTFSAKFTWQHDGTPAVGRSLTVAYDLKIPAIYVEGHGGRSIRYSDLHGYLDGVRRVLHGLNMLADAPQTTLDSIRVFGDGNTDKGLVAPTEGFLVTHLNVGERVSRGEVIAEIIDISGVVLSTVRATRNSYIMLLRRDAKISAGDTICITADEHGQC